MIPATQKASARATFTPLTKGFFRCNQTGEIVKKTKNYARTYYNKMNGNGPKPLKGATAATVILTYDNRWKCPNPNCKTKNRFGRLGEVVRCISCHNEYLAYKKEKASYQRGVW